MGEPVPQIQTTFKQNFNSLARKEVIQNQEKINFKEEKEKGQFEKRLEHPKSIQVTKFREVAGLSSVNNSLNRSHIHSLLDN